MTPKQRFDSIAIMVIDNEHGVSQGEVLYLFFYLTTYFNRSLFISFCVSHDEQRCRSGPVEEPGGEAKEIHKGSNVTDPNHNQRDDTLQQKRGRWLT